MARARVAAILLTIAAVAYWVMAISYLLDGKFTWQDGTSVALASALTLGAGLWWTTSR